MYVHNWDKPRPLKFSLCCTNAHGRVTVYNIVHVQLYIHVSDHTYMYIYMYIHMYFTLYMYMYMYIP